MKVFGLIGYPLGHSFSSAFFADKFRKEGHDAIYKNFELKSISSLKKIIELQKELSGLNVTIPYKSEIIPYLDEIDPVAEGIGAVNVIDITRGDKNQIKLKGYNTDIIGFKKSLKPLLNPEIKAALVLGTGGSSLAVRKGLQEMNISYKVISRSQNKGGLQYHEISSETLGLYPLIINTTPLGMVPETSGYPDIPYESLTSKNVLFDLVYNPELTHFLSMGQARGCIVKGGKEMLYLQAEAAWNIWNSQG